MLTLHFVPLEPDDPPSGFELGRLEVDVGDGAVPPTPSNHLMMVVPSAALLLGGVRAFLSSPRLKRYEFVGIGSSFRLVFTRAGKQIGVDAGGGRRTDVAPRSLAEEVLRAGVALDAAFGSLLPATDAAGQDLRSAITAFRQFLASTRLG